MKPSGDVWVRLCDRDEDPARFRERSAAADVVCAGDSITGWNNFGPASQWPFRTYPVFLQERIAAARLPWRVADAGIAGETSAGGVALVRRCLGWFPRAAWFAIGFGANDLAGAGDPDGASAFVLERLADMVRRVRDSGRSPLLLEVTPAAEGPFLGGLPEGLSAVRIERHNASLRGFAASEGIAVAAVHARLGPEHLGDGVHPTAEGARIIASAVFEGLSRDPRFARSGDPE
ncbi:MAG: GDSL-type esterase/lipase family protein [Planctomycetes bacterium]|jgi:lysophospholipase L1-like esterase|nr:GDSL-type esterase/lipase family protein [Planctomycetota bacterium]